MVLHHTATDSAKYCIQPMLYCIQGSFPKDEVREPNSGGSRISKWGTRLPRDRVWGDGCASPLPRKKFRFWISSRQNLVQTGCFLYSSPKADGLNAVLVRSMPKCQTLAICMPTNDCLLPLLGLHICVAEVRA